MNGFPILTLMLLERRFAALRLAGLALALGGLVLVVWQSIGLARFSLAGTGYALRALLCMTLGAIAQKGLSQSPLQTLPLQYASAGPYYGAAQGKLYFRNSTSTAGIDLFRTDGFSVESLDVVPGASHLFEEPGTLERVGDLAADWFTTHLAQAREAA